MAEAKERREEERRGGGGGGQLICINSTFWVKAAHRAQFRLQRPLSFLSPLSVFRSKTLSQSKRPHLGHLGGQPTFQPKIWQIFHWKSGEHDNVL